MHGDMAQVAREQALKRFRDGTVEILVATDVAARGIDVDGVTHVINYDVPRRREDLRAPDRPHRPGRRHRRRDHLRRLGRRDPVEGDQQRPRTCRSRSRRRRTRPASTSSTTRASRPRPRAGSASPAQRRRPTTCSSPVAAPRVGATPRRWTRRPGWLEPGRLGWPELHRGGFVRASRERRQASLSQPQPSSDPGRRVRRGRYDRPSSPRPTAARPRPKVGRASDVAVRRSRSGQTSAPQQPSRQTDARDRRTTGGLAHPDPVGPALASLRPIGLTAHTWKLERPVRPTRTAYVCWPGPTWCGCRRCTTPPLGPSRLACTK